MKKYFILLIAFFLFVSLGLNSKVNADKTNSALVKPTPDLPEIEKLELDNAEVIIPAPLQMENSSVKAVTTVRNPKNLPITYEYTISGGRIVGQGARVIWDLKGVRPGTYTITVAIDYGRGFISETKSRTVNVVESQYHPPCVCPTVDVSGGGNIKAGETVTFSANVAGGSATDFTYNWTVSQGEIIDGRGTKQITVKTTKEMSGTIEATVEVDAPGLCEMCLKTASETATVIK